MGFDRTIRCELPDEALVFDNPAFDYSIVGVTIDGRAVYDYESMIIEYMTYEDATLEEAIDWIEYNTIRSLPYAGEYAPIIIHRFSKEES